MSPSSICWKAVIGGLFVSAISYLILSALGAGVLGQSAQSAIEAERGGGLLLKGFGLWMAISALLSVFAGSYFASRVSGYSSRELGAAHGLVVGAVFFVLMACGVGSAAFSGLEGMASATKSMAAGGADLAANPEVQDALQKTVDGAQLKSDPKEVVQGLSYRIVRGDYASAKTYLAAQTGLPEDQIDAKIGELQAQVTDIAKKAGEASAKILAMSGWTVFITLVIGLMGAVFGGVWGNHTNLSHPLIIIEPLRRFDTATV